MSEFAQALFERRMTDYGIDVEYCESRPLSKHTVHIREPLHDQSPGRLIEAVENVAIAISNVSQGKRSKIICTKFTMGTAEIQIYVYEFGKSVA